MNLRTIAATALILAATLGTAAAELPKKIHRIGYLTIPPRAAQVHLIDAFERGLTERGYALGRDIAINLKTASELGITVPRTLSLQADHVVEK